MKMRIASAAIATVIAIGISTPSYAFMSVETEAVSDVQMSITDKVDALRKEITVGETSCDEMLEKLDAVLSDIDANLDAGATNEDELLVARDAVADMRLDLECLSKELTQLPIEGSFPPADMGSLPGGSQPGPAAGGGGAAGGGSGGAGGAAGGVGGAGGSLGAIGAVGGAVGAVAANNDDPGFRASGSQAN